VAKIDHTKTFRVRFDGWSSKYDEVTLASFRATNIIPISFSLFDQLLSATPDKFRTLQFEKIGNLYPQSTKRY
jgi:hypothetical protein